MSQPAVSSVAGAPAQISDEQPLDMGAFDDDEMTRMVEGGALAGAFAAAVAAKPVEASRTRPSVPVSSDEWFVGVNGVPVGPLRLSEIRSRAHSGAIGTESLVWREGFEEWLPLHKFPELVAIVEEGVSAARASTRPLEPPRDLADPFAREATAAAPVSAASSASVASAAPTVAVASAPVPNPALGSNSAPSSLPTRPSASLEDEPVVAPARRSGIAPAAMVAMVVAVGLGLALGFVMFGGEKTKIVREVVEVPAERPENAAPPPPAASAETAAAPSDTAAGKSPTGGAARGSQAKNGNTAAPQASQQGLSGLAGLKGLSSTGPQSGPSTDSGASSSGQPLDSSQVQATVGRYTSSVKRSCWQPALDTRDKDAPTSARVTVSITVGPDGRVTQATTSGDPRGYGGLASCISRRVQTWTFPPSSGTTTVNVPFVFAAQ